MKRLMIVCLVVALMVTSLIGVLPQSALADIPPTVTTVSAGNITLSSAILNGYLNDLGNATSVDVSFEWGLTTAYGNKTVAKSLTAAGPFGDTISPLMPGTTYHFKAQAVGNGTTSGSDMTFTTPVKPEVVTNAATSITDQSAILNGNLDALGKTSSVQVSFKWGPTTAYGHETDAKTMTTTGSFTGNLTDLDSDRIYHYVAKAVGNGTSYGDDMTFKTAETPTVITNNVTNVTFSAATLNGYLSNLGDTSSVKVSFEWGTTTSYGRELVATVSPMSATGAFSGSLTNLTAYTEYHCRAKAVGNGTSFGDDRTFTTGAAPDLAIVNLWGWSKVAPGETMTYAISYANNGTLAAQNVQVIDQLPSAVTFVLSPLGSYNQANRKVTWSVGTVAPGQSGLLTVNVMVASNQSAPFTNTASITTITAETNLANNQASWVTSIAAAHDPNNKSVSPSGNIAAGGTLNYTIAYKNVGTDTAYAVYITDVLDPNLDDATLNLGSSGGYYYEPSRTITWNIGDVIVNDSGSVSFSVKVCTDAPSEAVINNYATVHFPPAADILTNVVSSVVAYQGKGADISIVEAVDPDLVATIEVNVNKFTDPSTGQPMPGQTVACYKASTQQYDYNKLQILTVRAGDAPFSNPVFGTKYTGNTTAGYFGQTSFDEVTPQGRVVDVAHPLTVAKLVPRLRGCALDTVNLMVIFSLICDANGQALAEQTEPKSLTFQRGDVNGDGVVDIVDALYGAQYLVNLRDQSEIHVVNLASVNHDGSYDFADIIDCMEIAQYVAGVRDTCFNLVVQPTPGPTSGPGYTPGPGATPIPGEGRTATKDTRLIQQAPTTTFGTESIIAIQKWNGSNTQHALLEFDVSDLSGATITSAQLQLYYFGQGPSGVNPAGLSASVYKLTRTNWAESFATWITYDGYVSWTTPGGDYTTSSPSGGSATFGAFGWMTWDITAIVQDAASNASGKVELLVKFTTETVGTNYAPVFYSRNYGDANLVPRLLVSTQ
jgi:uncharacterized repeat protein (TIGR01451 family)